MSQQRELDGLPAFTALDSSAVLAGNRRGTSVQLDGTYFSGQLRAIEAFGNTAGRIHPSLEGRQADLRESQAEFGAIDVNLRSFTENGLWNASTAYRRQLQQIPEIDHIERQFPGECFVVPEWLQIENHLHYGARVYFFRDDESPTPEEVMGENIDAILNKSFQDFERYQGQLHGYPDCCIKSYHERAPHAPSPEWRSIEPFGDRIIDQTLGNGTSVSIDDVVPPFSDWDGRYAFFAREFFPEPGCEMAQTRGEAISQALAAKYPTQLVEDQFRINFGYNYLVARRVQAGGSRRPVPGALGAEHLLFYLPVGELLTTARYS
jgi:hypothetical protein